MELAAVCTQAGDPVPFSGFATALRCCPFGCSMAHLADAPSFGRARGSLRGSQRADHVTSGFAYGRAPTHVRHAGQLDECTISPLDGGRRRASLVRSGLRLVCRHGWWAPSAGICAAECERTVPLGHMGHHPPAQRKVGGLLSFGFMIEAFLSARRARAPVLCSTTMAEAARHTPARLQGLRSCVEQAKKVDKKAPSFHGSAPTLLPRSQRGGAEQVQRSGERVGKLSLQCIKSQ